MTHRGAWRVTCWSVIVMLALGALLVTRDESLTPLGAAVSATVLVSCVLAAWLAWAESS